MAFTLPIDIAGRACQHLGARRFLTWADVSREQVEFSFAYDKLRLAELSRNLWTFATRRVVLRAIGLDSVLWAPAAWAAGGNFAAGAVVAYTPVTGPYTGVPDYWQTATGIVSATTAPDVDPLWDHFTGPLAIDLYDTGKAVYQAGEIVLTPGQWVASTNYAANTVVSYYDTVALTWAWYVSLCDLVSYTAPPSDTANWAAWTSAGRGQGTFGVTPAGSPTPLIYPTSSLYLSLVNSNADQPLNACGTWLLLPGTFKPLQLVWPIGAGPSHELASLNAFYLPNAFLKRAPTDPKGGQQSYLGATSGTAYEDWVVEGPFLVTGDAGPLMLRFVANLTDVSKMTPLFCEGLAARLALDTCEMLTQSSDKETKAGRLYQMAIRDARGANAIEVGPISPVENKYVRVRS